MKQQEVYTANACIEYAATRMIMIYQGGVENTKMWEEVSRTLVSNHLNSTNIKPSSSTTKNSRTTSRKGSSDRMRNTPASIQQEQMYLHLLQSSP